MDYCFDTSAFGARHTLSLYDDPERPALVAGLLASGRVLITSVNVFEASACEDQTRRIGLIHLQKQLIGDYRPLLVPTELLRQVTLAHFQGAPNATITISDNHWGIWNGLHEPEQLGERERQEVHNWKLSLESPFNEAHREARSEFERVFLVAPQDKPLSVARVIRLLRENEQLILNTASPVYKRITGTGLDLPRMRTLFQDLPEWPLYLAGWAHSLYHRALKREGFGATSNPGTVDLMSAIYLRHCDYFVTADAKQRRALRVLNMFNTREPRTRVISYQEFRRRLVIQHAVAANH
jgi:hypothetical protein